MKKCAVIVVAFGMSSCYVNRDIQVNMLGAELVKIDTVYRYTGSEQLLIWKCSNDVEYISYEPMNKSYQVGSKMVVLVRR
jgi:hypothetical protein